MWALQRLSRSRMKTLLVMRHAKSDWNADYGRDHERPLNERGIGSARLMGKVLSDKGQAPDLVITSTALRAQKTAALAKEAGKWAADIAPGVGFVWGGRGQ